MVRGGGWSFPVHSVNPTVSNFQYMIEDHQRRRLSLREPHTEVHDCGGGLWCQGGTMPSVPGTQRRVQVNLGLAAALQLPRPPRISRSRCALCRHGAGGEIWSGSSHAEDPRDGKAKAREPGYASTNVHTNQTRRARRAGLLRVRVVQRAVRRQFLIHGSPQIAGCCLWCGV